MASNPEVRFPTDGFKRALDMLEKESFRLHSESVFQKATGGRASRLVYPTMRNVLRISDMLHVPAINLLLGKIKGVNFDLLPTDDTDRPERTFVRRGPWRDRRVIEAEAWQYFESGEDSRHPTLADTASHLGLSASGFHYLFPQFAAHIVKTRLQEASVNAAAFAASLSQRVHQLINQHYTDRVRGSFPLGRKTVVAQLLLEGRWSKNCIRAEVARVFDTMAIEEHYEH